MNRARSALSNLATFLLALLLAFFIWMSASEMQDPVRTRFLEAPVEFVGMPADSALVDAPARQTVQIRLEGPDSVLQKYTSDDFTATVDLSQVPSGQMISVPIVVNMLRTGADISFITPEQVDVLLEQQVARDIPVALDIRGSVARGHNQGEALIDPPTIRVSGPASRVNELDFALVTIFLNSTNETLVETTRPIFYDLSGRVASVTGLELSQYDATVTIPVEESAGFANKLITVSWTGEPAPGYRLLSVTAEPPSVLVEGRPAQVNRLVTVMTEPIDITGLTESFQQTAVLDLPGSITVDPEQAVTVTIQIEPILTTSTYNRVPELRGLRAGFQAEVVPSQVRVVLFGPLPVLDALSEDDVRVMLDLFGLSEGTHSIVPDVDIPDRGIEIRSVQPAAVTVTISPALEETPEPGDTSEAPGGGIAMSAASPVGPVRTAGITPMLCDRASVTMVTPKLGNICEQQQTIQ